MRFITALALVAMHLGTASAAPVSYLYDGRGRLRCVHYADLDRSVIYSYDAAGSRTQQETRAGACPAG
jgi:hypothetical protein